MSKQLLFILFFCIATLAAESQPVVYINAGSRTIYGTNQELVIDRNGQCRFHLREVSGVVKDSSFFNITAAQLDSFFTKATQVGFFNLNSKYESNSVDGSGIYISLNKNGQKKAVDLRNIDVPAINELVARLNEMLAPHRIRIYYFNPTPVNK